MAFLFPVRVTAAEANAFITDHHRHKGPVLAPYFSVGVADHHDGNRLCGVAVIGKPVSPGIDPEQTAEVRRLCVDGTRNAASFLLARAADGAFAMGYIRLITYTLPDEPGTSLRAAGFGDDGIGKSGRWDSRPGRQPGDEVPKRRWYRIAPWYQRAVDKRSLVD